MMPFICASHGTCRRVGKRCAMLMPALFDLLEDETEPSVRAVLGHWLVGYIHPYPDGNGRIARFSDECDAGFRGVSVDDYPG